MPVIKCTNINLDLLRDQLELARELDSENMPRV
jgi:hypothetical protein